MKCHLCSAWFEIKTDPENTRYVVVEGAKKQADEWDTEGQGVVQFKGKYSLVSVRFSLPFSVIYIPFLMTFVRSFLACSSLLAFKEEADFLDAKVKELQDDPFFKLEKEEEDKSKASEQHQQISQLYSLASRQWSDPWIQSQKLRKTFREEKKVLKAKKVATEEIRTRSGLHIELLPETEEDSVKAKLVEFEGKQARENELRLREVRMGGLVLGKRKGGERRGELERRVRLGTREQVDPFLNKGAKLETASLEGLQGVVKVVKKRGIENGNGIAIGNGHVTAKNGIRNTVTVGIIDGYTSESD